MTVLSSRVVSVDDSLEAVYDLVTREGWGDGLPVVPPTAERVEAMVAAAGRAPGDVVALVPPRGAPATIEKVAINAVLAGCRPEYFPVVVAAVAAAAAPEFNAYALNTTTSPASPLVIVNGPARHALGINFSDSCFGTAGRANATIGRALRLVQLNVGGSIPGPVSRSVFGQPGRYTMCIGEWEEKNPWAPLAVQKGLAPGTDAVTVACATGTQDIADIYSKRGQGYLVTIAHSIDWVGSNKMIVPAGEGEMLVILCPDWAAYIARDGFGLDDVKRFLHAHTQVPLARFPEEHHAEMRARGRVAAGDLVPLCADPAQFLVMVAGGLGGLHAYAIHTFGPTASVTRPFSLFHCAGG